jgi:hypothetical protein
MTDFKAKPTLHFFSLGCAASLVLISVTFSMDNTVGKLCTILGLASYLAFFSSGMGPGGLLVSSEVFAQCIRAKAMSVATFFNRFTATVMASSFLSVAEAISWAGFFLFLAGICVMGIIFLLLYLPETKGRSLEDMSVYFAEITGDRYILDLEERIRKQQRDLELSDKSSVVLENFEIEIVTTKYGASNGSDGIHYD